MGAARFARLGCGSCGEEQRGKGMVGNGWDSCYNVFCDKQVQVRSKKQGGGAVGDAWDSATARDKHKGFR